MPPPSFWPSMRAILGDNRYGRWQESLKYRTRMLLARPYRAGFLQNLAKQPDWQAMYRANPRQFQNLLSGFMDRRWGVKKRASILQEDLRVAASKFPPAWRAQLAQLQALHLCAIAIDPSKSERAAQNENSGLRLDLLPNTITKEGHWCLRLMDEEGQALYTLSFGFLDAHTALICSMQGGRQALETIQTHTKTCHGLRPHHLILQAFLYLCQELGISQILGIDPRHHMKGRFNQRQRLKFDYLALWQESGAALGADDYWQLPTTPMRKNIEEIASKKRSQYKKRYAMLDILQADMHSALTARTASPTTSVK